MFGINVYELLVFGTILLLPVFVILVVVLVKRNRCPLLKNPNLYPCPDCRNLVSVRATTCPRCGAPLIPSNNP